MSLRYFNFVIDGLFTVIYAIAIDWFVWIRNLCLALGLRVREYRTWWSYFLFLDFVFISNQPNSIWEITQVWDTCYSVYNYNWPGLITPITIIPLPLLFSLVHEANFEMTLNELHQHLLYNMPLHVCLFRLTRFSGSKVLTGRECNKKNHV